MAPLWLFRACLLRRGFGGLHAVCRQIEPERGALPWFAFDVHETAVLPDNTIDGGQSQTGALAHVFRGEERLKYLRAGFRVHA